MIGVHPTLAPEGVILTNDAANRDRAVFEVPDRFDLTRLQLAHS